MADLITNLSLVKNGQQTTWNAPEGKKIKSARIRWRARPSETKTVSARNTGTTSTTIPSLPSPATHFESHEFELSLALYNPYPFDLACRVMFEIVGNTYSIDHPFVIPPYLTMELRYDQWSFPIPTQPPWYGSRIAITGVQAWMSGQYYDVQILHQSCWAETRGTYVQTYPAVTNIVATYEGQQIAGPATLQNGAYSGWYSIPVVAGVTSISISHAMGGLGEVYYQLEITYLTIKPAWVMVDGVLREVVSIHAMVEGVLRQIDDTQIMIDNSPR